MLELLQWGLNPLGKEYPDSGPGSKWLLYGDEQLGYFGEINETELFSRQELAGVTFFAPSSINPAASGRIWLKFYFKNKIIYIAKMPFYTSTTWSDLYAAGLVYGTNDNGKYPYPAGTPVNQFNPVVKVEQGRRWTLIPRLPTGSDLDPAPYNATLTLSMSDTQQSEMTALFSRVWNGGNTGAITEKWDRFLNADLTFNNVWLTLCKESFSNNNAAAVIAGSGVYLYDRSLVVKNVVAHYRPVLELIDASKVPISPMPILTFTSPDPREIYLLDYRIPSNDPIVNYGVTNISAGNQASKDLAVTYSIDSSSPVPAIPGESNPGSSTWSAFTITGEYTA
jgi:hypothetical protein